MSNTNKNGYTNFWAKKTNGHNHGKYLSMIMKERAKNKYIENNPWAQYTVRPNPHPWSVPTKPFYVNESGTRRLYKSRKNMPKLSNLMRVKPSRNIRVTVKNKNTPLGNSAKKEGYEFNTTTGLYRHPETGVELDTFGTYSPLWGVKTRRNRNRTRKN